jgi:elongation factor Ts
LITKLGENIQITRLVRVEAAVGCVSSYVHGGRVGALVHIDIDDQQLARDLAMHITASQPVALRPEDVPEEQVQKEKSIRQSQAEAAGTPEHVMDKKVTGQVEKFKKESSLLGQPFVKDPKTSVAELLKQKGASVQNFYRYALGEGRETEQKKDFAQEVKEQVESYKHDK